MHPRFHYSLKMRKFTRVKKVKVSGRALLYQSGKITTEDTENTEGKGGSIGDMERTTELHTERVIDVSELDQAFPSVFSVSSVVILPP